MRSPRLVWAFHYGMYRFYRTHYAPKRRSAMNWLVYAGVGTRALATLVASVLAQPVRLLHGRPR